MAEPEIDEDLFADLYEAEADDPPPPAPAQPPPPPLEAQPVPIPEPVAEQQPVAAVPSLQQDTLAAPKIEPGQPMQVVKPSAPAHDDDYDRPLHIKEDGKMFIGGLNWETTDQSLKDYFSQFGDVVECTVMRDGSTGRSRGFGFLTFRDPKTVNTVMVKEHQLDGKLIDPKRAIPREEQDRTAKIFVGGVSQECTETEFKEFFTSYGRVLDATLMMDKNTGRPRGFGFVTFDSEAAVDRTLEHPIAIHNKMVEIKRAEPRGNVRADDDAPGKFGRGRGGGFSNPNFNNHNSVSAQADPNGQNGNANNMTPAQMAMYWQRMQQYFQTMQQTMAANMNPMAQMQNNPAMMQQFMSRQGMPPAAMQQMQQMGHTMGQHMGNGASPHSGSPLNGGMGAVPAGPRAGGFGGPEQLMYEQQKFERQQSARMQQGSFQGGITWDGMYDDVPAPPGMRGGFGGGGGGGSRGGPRGGRATPTGPTAQAPANAPTGPKNAGLPGANYRGGGRGGRRGFHPYARGGT